MAASPAAVRLGLMYDGYIEDVNAERNSYKQAPIPDSTVGIVRDMLNDEGVLRRNLLTAIENDNLGMMTTPNEGQGVYSFSTRALAVNADQLAKLPVNPDRPEQAASDPIAYNLHFTLAHESRHAVDADRIRDANQTLSDQVFAMAQRAPPHDYTDIARTYLARDMNFEVDAETTGVNAHVSRVQALNPAKQVSLYDIYQASPKDMGPYVDIEQTVGGPRATYKHGLVPAQDGIHLDAENPLTRATMGRLFYQDQGYEWRQGLNGVLNAINSVERQKSLEIADGQFADVRKDPRHPPQIDFRALGIQPPADPAERVAMGRVVDSSLPKPNEQGSPDREYFDFLRSRLPHEVSDDAVAHAMLKAKDKGMIDPSRVNPKEIGVDKQGTIWIGGQHGERASHDPAQTQPMSKTAGDLLTQAYEQAHKPPEENHQQKRSCSLM